MGCRFSMFCRFTLLFINVTGTFFSGATGGLLNNNVLFFSSTCRLHTFLLLEIMVIQTLLQKLFTKNEGFK